MVTKFHPHFICAIKIEIRIFLCWQKNNIFSTVANVLSGHALSILCIVSPVSCWSSLLTDLLSTQKVLNDFEFELTNTNTVSLVYICDLFVVGIRGLFEALSMVSYLSFTFQN